MGCNCEPKKYSVSMGCCQLVLAPIENYYTKYQIDKIIEDIEISGGCCITEDEVDAKIESAKTEIEAEIPSLSGYATEQWVEDKHYISGVDLSDYALKSEIPTVPTSNTAFTNDAGYLTEHQSLTAYSTTNEVNTLINQSVSGKADTTTVNNINSALTAHTADSTVHVSQTEKNTWNGKVDSSTLNNYMLKTQIWCGTQIEYDAITTKDNSVIYLIHE
jgi:hypothetical protein